MSVESESIRRQQRAMQRHQLSRNVSYCCEHGQIPAAAFPVKTALLESKITQNRLVQTINGTSLQIALHRLLSLIDR